MGNSEVGHLNLGAGAVVKQDLTRIDEAVADGTLAENEVLVAAMTGAERVHLIGLVSDGGVHSGWKHLRALIDLAAERGVPDLVDPRVHRRPRHAARTAARATSRRSRAGARRRAAGGSAASSAATSRWTATSAGTARRRPTTCSSTARPSTTPTAAEAAAEAAYERDETDEFITADDRRRRRDDPPGGQRHRLQLPPRPDAPDHAGARPIPSSTEVDRGGAEPVERYVTLTEYEEGWPYPVAFPPTRPEMTLAQVIAREGGKQLHVAETEKYPHVTYFFGGGEEEPEQGERRELVPSPRDVPTYDHKPEMSAREAADAFVSAWSEDEPRFGIINFANADMVGHTGVIEAAVKAIETVDALPRRRREGGAGDGRRARHHRRPRQRGPHARARRLAEHGPLAEPGAARSSPSTASTLRDGGVLADVAPTVLALLGVEQPEQMTGRSLIARVAPWRRTTADELYGLPLDGFVPERDALAKRLRADGKRARGRRDQGAAQAERRGLGGQPGRALAAEGGPRAVEGGRRAHRRPGGAARRQGRRGRPADRGRGRTRRASTACSRPPADCSPARAATSARRRSSASARRSTPAAIDAEAREDVAAGRAVRERAHAGLGPFGAAPEAAPAARRSGGAPGRRRSCRRPAARRRRRPTRRRRRARGRRAPRRRAPPRRARGKAGAKARGRAKEPTKAERAARRSGRRTRLEAERKAAAEQERERRAAARARADAEREMREARKALDKAQRAADRANARLADAQAVADEANATLDEAQERDQAAVAELSGRAASAAEVGGRGRRDALGRGDAGSRSGVRRRSSSSRCGSYCGGSFSASPSDSSRLVVREADVARGELEEHAAGLAEVDRVEVLAVDDVGRVGAGGRSRAAR